MLIKEMWAETKILIKGLEDKFEQLSPNVQQKRKENRKDVITILED